MSVERELLPEVLRRRALGEPERVLYRFLDDTGAESTVLTYRDLHRRALGVAAALLERLEPGQRALLIFPQGPDFVVAWFGCLYAGVVAVPVNPPRRGIVAEATRAVVADCAPAAVLTQAAFADALRGVLGPTCPARHWLGVDAIAPLDDTVTVSATPEKVAFLQYTSGSTSTPKGVMVTHGNLAANEEMIRLAFGHDRDSTVVGWAPFFHDQGLIGNVLQPLYVGATAILMSPIAFIRRPLLWLTTISRYRAHTSGGPNFAFEACLARAAAGSVPDCDLSSWRVAFNGAEPIRADTLTRFADAFAPYGFDRAALYPCYGLAEATLLVTGSVAGTGFRAVAADPGALGEGRFVAAAPDASAGSSEVCPEAAARTAGRPSSDPDVRVLVSSGRVLSGERVRIVDPTTHQPCPPERVGEIWVSGEHVAQGYWNRPDATEETFRGRCADDPATAYLRTGDLGLLLDGELHVVGRLGDMVVIRGRNHHPHDIEATVARAHPALRPGGGAAFGTPGRDGEQLVVVAEIRRDASGIDRADITGAVRAAVLREHEIALGDLVLTGAGALAKTSSGKIMRAAARRTYLGDGFAPWTPDRSEPLRTRS